MASVAECVHSIARVAIVFVVVLIGMRLGNEDHIIADDWPQWRGPKRDGVSAETGLLASWPTDGPPLAWKISDLGNGYASVVIGSGRLFTLGRHGTDVLVSAIDSTNGTSHWTRKIGESSRSPNSTPTVDGEYLYALDPDGDLVCLKSANGEIVWQKRFVEDFAGRIMSGRGHGESPLIDGDRLVCTPGGADAEMVALDKLTGDVIWKATLPDIGPHGRDGAGFSSVVISNGAGVRQYVQLMGRGVVGIDAQDGRFLWGYNKIANDSANIPTPVVHDDFVFAANGYTAGSVLLKLVSDGSDGPKQPRVKAEVVYALSGSQFQNHHGGFIRIGDYLYAGHGNNNGLPTCLEFMSGRVVWKRRGPGVGSAAVVYADGNLIFRYQDGVVALIEASPAGFKLKGTFQSSGTGGDSWSHPVVANGFLYLREQDTLSVYDLRGSTETKSSTAAAAVVPNTAITSLEKRGIKVETLNRPVQKSPLSQTRQRIFDYILDITDQTKPGKIQLVTLSDSHLSPTGTITDEVFELLKAVSEPLVVDLAGTHISDSGLAQLHVLRVVGLNLELCRHLSDAGWAHLRQMDSLQALVLAGTSMNKAGLQQLASHPNLIAIDLELCDGINDNACETLGAMRRLRFLVLKKSGFERPGITETGLQQLRGLTSLESLNLYGNTLTDDALTHLLPFKKLRELNLSLLDITDTGLEHLQSLKSLEHLDLLFSEGFAGPTLTDKAVEFLTPLTNLTTLNLTGSKLTDQGLERLRSLKKLKRLQLARTRVTPEGIQQFRASIPECEIIQ